MNSYECPLCTLEFEGEECRAACGIALSCNMVRCPRCNYEFVQDSSILNYFRRLITRRKPDHASSAR